MQDSRHIWTVDALDDGAAAIEVDGRQVTTVPRWILPSMAKEGDVLTVHHLRGGGSSTLMIKLDEEATRAAFERSSSQVETMRELMEERRRQEDPDPG